MKLEKYLTETPKLITNEYVDVVHTLEIACAPYLKLLKSKNLYPFLKGINGAGEYGGTHYSLYKNQTRAIRRSRGMQPRIAKQFNKWLKDNNHVTRDGSVIVTGSDTNAKYFGTPHFVFPVGKINYTWAETYDLNRTDDKTSWNAYTLERFFDNDGDNTWQGDGLRVNLNKPISDMFHTNKQLEIASKSGYETWFNCKYFYLLDATEYDNVILVKELFK